MFRCGANVNMRGPEGETALHLAAAGGHHEVVKFLLNEGADADIQDDVSVMNDFISNSLYCKDGQRKSNLVIVSL